MTTRARYWLFQAPGLALTGLFLMVIRQWISLPLSVVLGVLALVLIKDFLLYPLLRSAYATGVKTGVAQLINSRGIVKQDINPEGYVLIRGELWRARLEYNDRAAPRGTEVQVRDSDGMILIVEPVTTVRQ